MLMYTILTLIINSILHQRGGRTCKAIFNKVKTEKINKKNSGAFIRHYTMIFSVQQTPCAWLNLVSAYNLSLCKVHLIRGSTRVKASKEESIALMIAPTTESFRHLFRMIGWLDYHDSSFVNTNYFGIKVSKGIHVFWMT